MEGGPVKRKEGRWALTLFVDITGARQGERYREVRFDDGRVKGGKRSGEGKKYINCKWHE